MAEAFGIFSGVCGVMQLVGNATYDYLQAVKDAPETAERLTQELKMISRILQQLLDLVKDGVALSSEVMAAGHDCDKHLRLMLKEMEGYTSCKKLIPGKSGAFLSFGLRLKWPLKEKKIQEWLVQLERYKSTFDLELQSHSLYVLFDSNFPSLCYTYMQ